jgi:Flp pilus assembly protein TadG
MKRSNRRRRTLCGQTLVEFALFGPLFFLMLFGVIEGGRLVFTNHEIAHGTREGARYAMVHGSKSGSPATDASVKSAMLSKMTAINSSKLSVSRSYPSGNSDPGSKVRVTATYTFQPIVSMVFGTGNITLNHTSEVTIQH